MAPRAKPLGSAQLRPLTLRAESTPPDAGLSLCVCVCADVLPLHLAPAARRARSFVLARVHSRAGVGFTFMDHC